MWSASFAPVELLVRRFSEAIRPIIGYESPLSFSTNNRHQLFFNYKRSLLLFVFACRESVTVTEIRQPLAYRPIWHVHIPFDCESFFISPELEDLLGNKVVVIYHNGLEPESKESSRTLKWYSENTSPWYRNYNRDQCYRPQCTPIASYYVFPKTRPRWVTFQLCLAVNESTNGTPMSTRLIVSGLPLLKFIHQCSEDDPVIEKVDLINCSPHYAAVRLPHGKKQDVPFHHLAPRIGILTSTGPFSSTSCSDSL